MSHCTVAAALTAGSIVRRVDAGKRASWLPKKKSGVCVYLVFRFLSFVCNGQQTCRPLRWRTHFSNFCRRFPLRHQALGFDLIILVDGSPPHLQSSSSERKPPSPDPNSFIIPDGQKEERARGTVTHRLCVCGEEYKPAKKKFQKPDEKSILSLSLSALFLLPCFFRTAGVWNAHHICDWVTQSRASRGEMPDQIKGKRNSSLGTKALHPPPLRPAPLASSFHSNTLLPPDERTDIKSFGYPVPRRIVAG